jgi:hypothetical protein
LSSSSSSVPSHPRHLDLSTVGGPVAVQTGNLASGELLVASTIMTVSKQFLTKSTGPSGANSLVRVVHVVVDGVKTRLARARVTADGAARAGARLGRRIGDTVTRAGAAALEGVVQTEPVAGLVRGRLAEVEANGGAAGEGVLEDGAAVADEGAGAGGGGGGEVAVAEVSTDGVEDVDVEGGVGAAAEGLLHGGLAAVAGPDRVDGRGAAGVAEVDAVGGEVVTEDVELRLQSGGLYSVS